MPTRRKLGEQKLQHAGASLECKDGFSPRRCLCCDGWFCSSGAGNRQCFKCFDDSAHSSKRQRSAGHAVMDVNINGNEEY